MKSINTAKLTIQSLPENIALARVFVAAFITQVDLTVDELEDIKVAVSEAVSNAIIHGYEQRGDQWVDIIVTRFDDYFEITIKDDGKGIENIEQAMEPTYSTDADRMGLGFVFMQSFMDEVAVTSEVNQGTIVTLRKYVAANQDAPN
jgi:stage II sporulation protein AB (anti-sigma F factor)